MPHQVLGLISYPDSAVIKVHLRPGDTGMLPGKIGNYQAENREDRQGDFAQSRAHFRALLPPRSKTGIVSTAGSVL